MKVAVFALQPKALFRIIIIIISIIIIIIRIIKINFRAFHAL
jgi:hypothetical protein